MSFKHNTGIWGYYGYEKDSWSYASNKYKQESNKLDATLGDDFVIQKISDGRFSTLGWKKSTLQ